MILGLRGALQAAPAAAPAPSLTCDAALAALFTPPTPLLGRYEVCTTPAPLDRLLATIDMHHAGVEALGPLDAFGAAGPYDRSQVARLYGGTRAQVVHGWRQDGARFVSTTLISPYPDATLTRLMPGTMAIRWTTTRAAGRGQPEAQPRQRTPDGPRRVTTRLPPADARPVTRTATRSRYLP